MLNKFNKFNNQKLFEQIDDQVKTLMLDVHKKLSNIDKDNYTINFTEKYGFISNIQIIKNDLKTIPVYHAQISIMDIIKNDFKKIDIVIYVEDNLVNSNKLYSILAHEYSHYYQLLSGNDIYFDSFNKMIKIEEFKSQVIEYKKSFLNYIYYNLQHELDARVNQAYEGYLYSKLKTLDEMYKDFMNSELSYVLKFLFDFDTYAILNNFMRSKLLDLTNQFNILYDIDQINISKLEQYYKNWEIIFKKNSEEYVEKSKIAIKQAFDKEKRYEKYISYCYDERPLYENNKYNIEEEIKNLVNKFKQLPL